MEAFWTFSRNSSGGRFPAFPRRSRQGPTSAAWEAPCRAVPAPGAGGSRACLQSPGRPGADAAARAGLVPHTDRATGSHPVTTPEQTKSPRTVQVRCRKTNTPDINMKTGVQSFAIGLYGVSPLFLLPGTFS